MLKNAENCVKLRTNFPLFLLRYETNWVKSGVKFEDRFDKYLDASFFQHRIHWFSIFNSFMMVIFLIGLVSMILMRTLRKDYQRYSVLEDGDDMERDLGDEYGWKQVHGDVFRTPAHPILLSVMIGTGYQVASVVFFVTLFAIFGELYTERGSMLSAAIFVYAATSPINGYFGGGLYSRFNGRKWIKQMILSAFFLPILICGTRFLDQLHRHLLSCFSCHSVWIYGSCDLYLFICNPSPNIDWNCLGTQPGGNIK